MSGRRLLTYWLEFADAAEGPLSDAARGPLSPSAVRHENRDLVLAVHEASTPATERDAALARWRAYWETQTRCPLLVRPLGDTFDPIH